MQQEEEEESYFPFPLSSSFCCAAAPAHHRIALINLNVVDFTLSLSLSLSLSLRATQFVHLKGTWRRAPCRAGLIYTVVAPLQSDGQGTFKCKMHQSTRLVLLLLLLLSICVLIVFFLLPATTTHPPSEQKRLEGIKLFECTTRVCTHPLPTLTHILSIIYSRPDEIITAQLLLPSFFPFEN